MPERSAHGLPTPLLNPLTLLRPWPGATRASAWGGLALLLAAAASAPAQAGLFDDDEARKAILELRGRVTQNDEATKARLNELSSTNAALTEAIAALRKSLLDLNNQLELTRAELARQRGASEQLAREVAELQKAQRDTQLALDQRLRRVEPQKVQLDGAEFLAEPEEKRAYDEAMALLRSGDFDKTASALATFQRRYAGSGYLPSVRFWLGNAQYGKKDHREAITTFRSFVADYPQHPKAAEAMLALANSQAELKDVRGARQTINELVKAHPQSEAAQAGRERLASLR
jgi:tol-pal system protein YbgF